MVGRVGMEVVMVEMMKGCGLVGRVNDACANFDVGLLVGPMMHAPILKWSILVEKGCPLKQSTRLK